MSIFTKKESTVKKPVRKTKAASTAKTVSKTASNVKSKTERAHHVLLKPLISEKATMVNALNKYVFAVSIHANKVEIKKAIIELYNVIPVSVNIVRSSGKFVRSNRGYGQRKDSKKAIVTLRKGDSIKLYEGI